MQANASKLRNGNRKNTGIRWVFILSVAVIFGLSAAVFNPVDAGMFVYPTKGQSKDQQGRDEYECHQWAVQQTGFDPSKKQPVATGQSSSGGGEVGKGAVGGALLGLAIGSLGGKAGAGAAVGAGAGALFGGMKRHDREQQQAASSQQAQANQQAQMSQYNKAKQACLEAKGYSVK